MYIETPYILSGLNMFNCISCALLYMRGVREKKLLNGDLRV